MLSARQPAAPLVACRAQAPVRRSEAAPPRPPCLQIVQQRSPQSQKCRALLGGGGDDAALAVPPAEEAQAAAAVATHAADDSAKLRCELEELKRR